MQISKTWKEETKGIRFSLSTLNLHNYHATQTDFLCNLFSYCVISNRKQARTGAKPTGTAVSRTPPSQSYHNQGAYQSAEKNPKQMEMQMGNPHTSDLLYVQKPHFQRVRRGYSLTAALTICGCTEPHLVTWGAVQATHPM